MKRVARAFLVATAALAALPLSPATAATSPAGAPVSGASTPAVQPCGAVGTPVPTASSQLSGTSVVGPVGVRYFSADSNGLTVSLSTGHVQRYSPAGQQLLDLPVSAFDTATAPDGTLFVSSGTTASAYSPSGQLLWTKELGTQVLGVYGRATSSGWRAAYWVSGGSRLLDVAGAVTTSTVTGTHGAPTPDGGLVTFDGHYLRYWDSGDRPTRSVGAPGDVRTPTTQGMAAVFQQPGNPVVLPDGRTLMPDAKKGLLLLDARGLITGVVPGSTVGGLTQDGWVALVGSTLYVATGNPFSSNQYVRSFALQDVLALTRTDTTFGLGFGAGVVTGRPLNYVPSGATPSATVTFDPWWQADAGDFDLVTTTRTADESKTQAPGLVVRTPLTAAALSAGVAVPLASRPGPQQIDARLVDVTTGRAAAATCLTVAVGAPGDQLDVTDLPPGADAGGPTGARAAVLGDVLGTGLVRVALDWGRMLPSGTGGPTDYTYYDKQVADASAEAARRGVPLEVQFGSGGPEKTFVSNGTWGARVSALVSHWKSQVHAWEIWNEPNITFGGAAEYVTQVLKPAYAAVKAADPSALVVGGTTCGVSLGYWQQLAAAGGFQWLDVLGVHPYTGNNESFEEAGVPADLRALHSLAAANGAGGKPVWVTEHAWWSDGDYNWWAQADNSVRARLWYRQLGIPGWAYFIPEGSWGNNGVTFSAIQVDDAVKPAALALMATKTQLADRAFLGDAAVESVGLHAFHLGPASASNDEVYAVWTDEARLPLAVTADREVDATIVDEYGASTPAHLGAQAVGLTGSGAVSWIHVPSGTRVTVLPQEQLGTSALAGSSASASSSHWPVSHVDDQDATSASEWSNQPEDSQPTVTVTLPQPVTLDRVAVATHSNGSTVSGLRDYDVQVQASPSGSFVTVATVRGQFFERRRVLAFPPQQVSAVRLVVTAVNYTGYAGGAMPSWGPTGSAQLNDPNLYGQAVVSDLSAFTPQPVTSVRTPAESVAASAPSSQAPSGLPGAPVPGAPAASPVPPLLVAPAVPPLLARPRAPQALRLSVTRRGRSVVASWTGGQGARTLSVQAWRSTAGGWVHLRTAVDQRAHRAVVQVPTHTRVKFQVLASNAYGRTTAALARVF